MEQGKEKPRKGFTLIEMLVVLLIIAILAGLTLSLVGVAGRQADRAKTRRILEMLANAIEEFRAEYGRYPPVAEYADGNGNRSQPMYYEYANAAFLPNKTQLNWACPGASRDTYLGTADGRVYTFGLCSFLVTRYAGHAQYSPDGFSGSGTCPNQWKDFNSRYIGHQDGPDLPRDQRALQRIDPFISPIIGGGYMVRAHVGVAYTNSIVTVRDAWDRDIYYRSNPPYENYVLWSAGPDGSTSGTRLEQCDKDDIYAGRE